MRSTGVIRNYQAKVNPAGGSYAYDERNNAAVMTAEAVAIIAIRFYFTGTSAEWEAGVVRMYGLKK